MVGEPRQVGCESSREPSHRYKFRRSEDFLFTDSLFTGRIVLEHLTEALPERLDGAVARGFFDQRAQPVLIAHDLDQLSQGRAEIPGVRERSRRNTRLFGEVLDVLQLVVVVGAYEEIAEGRKFGSG